MGPNEIVSRLSPDQKKTVCGSLGDALDIVCEIVGNMPYSRLFALTISVIEIIQEKRL